MKFEEDQLHSDPIFGLDLEEGGPLVEDVGNAIVDVQDLVVGPANDVGMEMFAQKVRIVQAIPETLVQGLDEASQGLNYRKEV